MLTPTRPLDEVSLRAQTVEHSARHLLAALDDFDGTIEPAALKAFQQTVALLEEFAGRVGNTLHAMARSQDSDPWDRTAVDLYNTVAKLHDVQTLLAAARSSLAAALAEDLEDSGSEH